MSYHNKLKYAGSDPFEPEDERLPYRVFEALSQDETYTKLAQTRWLVNELETELALADDVPNAVSDAVFRAAVGRSEGSLRAAVDVFVSEWLVDNAEQLIDELEIDAELVADACDTYDVADAVEVGA